MIETMAKVSSAMKSLQQQSGQEPSPEEVAQAAGIPVAKAIRVLRVVKEPVSFDTFGDEYSNLRDTLEDKTQLGPLENATNCVFR
jgi:RNA polymerase primary sigma factor